MKLLAIPNCSRLSDAMTPLMFLIYLMGLRVFKYPRGNAGTVLSLIYLLFLLGIYVVSVNAERRFYKSLKLMKLEYVLYELMVYVSAFVVTCEMIFSWLYTKRLNTCYRKIDQIDETLRQFGSMFNYKIIYFFTVAAMIGWFLYIVFTVIVTFMYSYTDLQTKIWLTVTQIYIININSIIMVEFLLFVKCLQMKFKLLNELLKESAATSTMEGIKMGFFAAEDYAKIMNAKHRRHFFSIKELSRVNRQLQSRIRTSLSRKRNRSVSLQTRSRLPPQLQKQFQMELQSQSKSQAGDVTSIQRSVVIPECQKRKHLLQTVRQIHLELSRVSRTLCTSFGMQITAEIGISIMAITGLLYTLYINLIQQKNHFNNTMLKETYVAITMGVTFVLKIILLNYICKNATYEGQKTTEIIHEIYKYCEDIDMREEVQQFGLQMSQNPVNFSGFGVSLNYQVLVTCLKTVSTYLVIMIQMSHSLEFNKNT